MPEHWMLWRLIAVTAMVCSLEILWRFFKRGELVKDLIASERVRLPDERIGLLMVFDTYETMSFALVMEADRQIDLGDLLRNP